MLSMELYGVGFLDCVSQNKTVMLTIAPGPLYQSLQSPGEGWLDLQTDVLRALSLIGSEGGGRKEQG
jgi:hypothetical protein